MRKAIETRHLVGHGKKATISVTVLSEVLNSPPSTKNRRQLSLTVTGADGQRVVLLLDAAAAGDLARAALGASVLIETEGDVARRYLSVHRGTLQEHQIEELGKRAKLA